MRHTRVLPGYQILPQPGKYPGGSAWGCSPIPGLWPPCPVPSQAQGYTRDQSRGKWLRPGIRLLFFAAFSSNCTTNPTHCAAQKQEGARKGTCFQGHRRALHGLLAGRNAAGFERPKAKTEYMYVSAGVCIQVHVGLCTYPPAPLWGNQAAKVPFVATL